MRTAVIIGLGSMGRRRARLLKQIDPSVCVVGVDLRESRRESFVEGEFGSDAFAFLGDVFDEYDPYFALVCTSPASHAAIITECLRRDLHVFTEINLIDDGYDENMALAHEKGLVLFLSSTFLYRKETRYISKIANDKQCGSYSYHVGQYLPDWHPWESIEDYFVSDSRTNGCRELFAIELPWLTAAFGPVKDVRVVGSTQSTLNLPYKDSYAVILEHSDGAVGTLSVDVVSKKPIRRFEMWGEDVYLTWEGTPSTLEFYDAALKDMLQISLYGQGEGINLAEYAEFVVEDAYCEELRQFIGAMDNGLPAKYGFSEDVITLKLINQIEGA